MATKGMWEVDPETRQKLVTIQQEPGNSLCCDCNAPSPQWASPKFGIFICLSCAGVHRGLGVHISFVRSISMDAFKSAEIERMRLGGNENWKKFWAEHEETKMLGVGWDDTTIADRYSGEVGEEYKERLGAKVEGREYIKGEKPKVDKKAEAKKTEGTPPPAMGSSEGGGKIKVDVDYFAKLGEKNATRSADLPPSQGGKYQGFGSSGTSAPAPRNNSQNQAGLPGLDDLQKDPVAALSKGFGWFTSTVTKTAKTVNEGFIQPTAKQIAESDFAAQARIAAATAAKTAQAGAKTASDGLTRFVEGPSAGGYRPVNNNNFDESKRAFWDDFASAADNRKTNSNSIGTSAMNKGSGSGAPPKPAAKDEWDDW